MDKPVPEPHLIPLDFRRIEQRDKQLKRAEEFYENLNRRRTVREYSDRDVAFELIEKAI